MKALFDQVSTHCSKYTTKNYSTSFSLGIYFLDRKYHTPIYNIYGFVRFADEIVDSFEGYNQAYLLEKFWNDTYEAIDQGISLNPILNSFQHTVNKYNIERELVDTFLKSMEMDLKKTIYSVEGYKEYILGSAEVVGLMCLRVFTNGDEEEYQKLKPSAMRLGAAFQKVNFLRDAKADFEELGRSYFPGVNLAEFTQTDKLVIEKEIEEDFKEALKGIKLLPRGAKRGVYLAYIYYLKLFCKIKSAPADKVMNQRIRISNPRKFTLMMSSMVRYKFNLL
jgi:15-cis-phytoene synthase